MIITILPQYFGVKKNRLASLVLKFQLMGRLNHPLKMLTLELKFTKLEKKNIRSNTPYTTTYCVQYWRTIEMILLCKNIK